MVVEADSQKTSSPNTGETRNLNPNPNPNPNGNPRPQQGGENDDEDDELEEGEIVGEEKPSGPVTYQAHPLEHQWTFWYDNPSAKSKQSTWGSYMRSIYTFSTVEEFWSVYNNLRQPSKLTVGADFHCFKYKIEPKWEDPVCANGGKWTVTCLKGKSDTSWLYTLLAMIGEQFDHGDEICGAVVSVRIRQEKIALWTKNASNEAAQ
uniref:Eukaryotic translation initiation factor 4E-1 n=1 Tax=Rhizophora mucronata TaxID=61149 RepID=A0A2P2M829_RHIMU